MTVINTTHTANRVYQGEARQVPTVYSANQIEYSQHRIDTLQRAATKVEQKYVTLVYDIPDSKKKECPNPSRILWRHAFRLNLSCWVLPESRLSHPDVKALLELWGEQNLETHILEFSERQLAKIREIARNKLADEIRRVHTSLMTCIFDADKRLDDLTTAEDLGLVFLGEKTLDDATRKRNTSVKAAIKKAQESLAAAGSCAEAFEETESVQTLLEGLREAIQASRDAYNAEMLAKGGRPIKG